MKIKNIKIQKRLVAFVVCLILLAASPFSNLSIGAEEESQDAGEIKIAVISDAHLYASSLGSTGVAFEEYISKDRKMIKESELILDAALTKIKASTSDVVLITGDLSKDGEKVNHELMAQKLKEVEEAGKKVYVINGNHDISNAKAFQYLETGKKAISTISSKDFKEIYQDFGYGEAISQDKESLSYVVEPAPGYRIIAIDASKYNDSTSNPSSEAAGEIKASTMVWIKEQIKDARAQGKEVIGMIHQGVVPHFSVEATLFPIYLVKDYSKVANELADAGLSLIFTGHFHAQDISGITTSKGNKLYDVETGSMVTYPVPIRNVTIKDHVVVVTSTPVDQVEGLDLKGYANFEAYSREFLKVSLKQQVQKVLTAAFIQRGMGNKEAYKKAELVSKSTITGGTTVEEYLINCMVKHYAGDEVLEEATSKISQTLLSSSDSVNRHIGRIGLSFSTDSGGNVKNPIPDNTAVLTINPAIYESSVIKTLYYGGDAGKTTTIKISVPKGINYSVHFKSSKNGVATVSQNGKITAKKNGSTIIKTTVKIKETTKVYSTIIKVKKAYLDIKKSKATMKLGNQYTFSAKAYGYSDQIVWYTTKKKIVAINKKTGKAIAKTRGTDYVIASVGKVSKKISVVVK